MFSFKLNFTILVSCAITCELRNLNCISEADPAPFYYLPAGYECRHTFTKTVAGPVGKQ